MEGPKKMLEVVLCSTEFAQDEAACMSLLTNCGFNYQNLSCENLIPKQGAPTKELAIEWSELYWPLNWCGNPNDQILNEYTFDIDFIREKLAQITSISQEEAKKGNKVPVVTAFVNPCDAEHPIVSTDQRSEVNDLVLDHSIMIGIRKVAEDTKLKESQLTDSTIGTDSTYLCLNFDVYTTHEPCSMCSMALIHSRVKRCIFIRPMSKTGTLRADSGDGYCMHCNNSLNSKFEVFQWIGNDFAPIEIESNLCA